MPAYTFPEIRQDLSVLRIVVRAGMTHEMATLLLESLAEETSSSNRLTARCQARPERRTAFAHN